VTAVVEGSAEVVSQSVAELLGAGVQPGSVVCAAVSDGPVAGWLVVEETAAAGEERRCAVVRLEGAPTRWGCNANIPAPPAGSKTPK